jgi:hypothetical protein
MWRATVAAAAAAAAAAETIEKSERLGGTGAKSGLRDKIQSKRQ